MRPRALGVPERLGCQLAAGASVPCPKNCLHNEGASVRWQKSTGLELGTRSWDLHLAVYWLWGLGSTPVPLSVKQW